MNPKTTNAGSLRSIPSVTKLLDTAEVAELLERYPRASLLRAVRHVLDELREGVLDGRATPPESAAELAPSVLAALQGGLAHGLRRVINATGIVAHTGLGRSVMPKDAMEAIMEEAKGYCLLQIDRDTGGRTRRDEHCIDLLKEITGAEDAAVVNNNSAATMLILNSLAEGKEVIISRGQLVEIGGSFRIPDVLKRSGCTLVEVGCTNKTHLRDYAEAITENTGALMRIHTSNYRMVGFVKEVGIEEMVGLGRERGIPVVDDLGAGAFLDLRPLGFPEEPLVQDSIAAGADVITMSADKLIGGPQGGIIVGKKEWVDPIRKSPLARVVRVGKLTLIALEATLKYFLDRKRAFAEHPTTRMLTMPLAELKRRARLIARKIGKPDGASIEVLEDTSEVGSGSYPAHQIPTFVVAIAHDTLPAEEIALRLRRRPLGVFGRIKHDQVLLDPRTIQEGEEAEVAEAVREVVGV
ncbi:MAG: L-seryl-tRNA(Sec) selenium transferase [Planctomycetota bacterium]|jgi:L-seryl-tRNA(Ser) seleniumtransferase